MQQPTYSVVKSVDIDFAHHVHGHDGPCLSIHGHTWKFELCLTALELDHHGFVMDFGTLKKEVLSPVHSLLDHGFLVYHETLKEHNFFQGLSMIHKVMRSTGEQINPGSPLLQRFYEGIPIRGGAGEMEAFEATAEFERIALNGALDYNVGGLKIVSFPTPPTSERIAEWLHTLAESKLGQGHRDRPFRVEWARVYETLHPVQQYAEYRPAQ